MLHASLAILNANIITLSRKKPKAEAVAIYDGKFVAVGSNKNVREFVNAQTKVVDVKNQTVVPGLVDCHVHMTGFGYSLQSLDLRNVKSIKEMQQKLREYAQRNPALPWILGRKWDQEQFEEKRYPTCSDLDAVVPDRPVFLRRVCGHACVVNSRALQAAEITEKTSVKSGKIDLDQKTKKPTGILRENAINLVSQAIPQPSPALLERVCLLACQNALKTGLTCVHWLVESTDEIRAIQRLHMQGKLPLRVRLGIPVPFLDDLLGLGLITGFGNSMIKIGPIKILADGSLGAHTASMKRPYADKPDTKGMMLYTAKELNALVSKTHKAGLQLAIHAIGDHAIERVLDAFENALKEHPRKNHRHRVEHCSVLNPKLIDRLKRLKLIASVQPHFVPSDFWVAQRVGKTKARWVYPFKTLLQKKILVVSGSDSPVEPINPLLGIWAAVNRKDSPMERLTVKDALKTYTLNAAYSSSEENIRGTIEPGKLADLTVLSEDITKIPPEHIRKVQVEMVVVNGKIVYKSKQRRL